jgi:hypothetical protein
MCRHIHSFLQKVDMYFYSNIAAVAAIAVVVSFQHEQYQVTT